MNNLIIYVIFLSFIPLCVIGTKRRSIGDKLEGLISIDNSNYIKGVSACGVFFAHSYNFLDINNISNIKLLSPFSLLGGMGVLMFFFVGGYGIYKSFEKKQCVDIKQYWKKRLLNVYIPAVVINIFFMIIKSFMYSNWSWKSIINTGLFGAWYIDVVMIEYFLFFICTLMVKNDKKKLILLMMIYNTIMFIIFAGLNLEERWRNGLYVYVFGILVACYEDAIRRIIKNKFLVLLISNVILFFGTGVIFTKYKGLIWADFVKSISGCALAIILICLFQKYKVGNKLMNGIGKRSLYVYLIHLGVLEVIEFLYNGNQNYVYYIIALIISTCIITEVVYRSWSIFLRKYIKGI